MLKTVKADREIQAVSADFTGISMTRVGHLRVVLNKGTQDRETISRTLQNAIGNNAKSITFKDLTKVQISDVDEEATDDEVLAAIAEKIGNINSVKIASKRKVGRGVQLVYVSIPSAVAHKVTPRLRIGYTNCRTKQITEVKKCFKCQAFGPIRSSCTGTEVEDRCWKCGEIGHKSRDCEGNPKCFLCEKEATDDHILGSYKCHVYRRALGATKTK